MTRTLDTRAGQAQLDIRTHVGLVEARARENGDAQPTLAGYAAVFGEEAVIGGWFREVIDAGAFDEALARPDDVRAQFNHDANRVLGRTTAKTLRLAVDAQGLRYEIDLPDTSYAKDLAASVERGDVTQSSFMFEVTGEKWEYPPRSSGELPLRRVQNVKLYDVAPVTFPAYAGTSVSARALELAAEGREVVPPRPDQTADLLMVELELDEAAG